MVGKKNIVSLHLLLREETLEKTKWFGSSVWLEYMPVTHGVASSSLVRTAKKNNENNSKESIIRTLYFFIYNRNSKSTLYTQPIYGLGLVLTAR